MQDFRTLATADPTYPTLLFFYMGSVAEGQEFFAKAWPEARAVSDPSKIYYSAFGLARGSLGQLLSPGVVACGLRAAAKGHIGGKPVGDPQQMPGLFLVQGADVLWKHDFAHAGDHPDLTMLPKVVADRATT